MTGRPRVLVVQHSECSGPGRLLDWLAEEGIDAVLVAGADLPEHLAEGSAAVDGLVLLGGGFLPVDDERAPFLPRERALVSEAVTATVPVLGICLGAQLLAHVAGGEVTARSGETERGSCPVDLLAAASDDPLFGGLTGYNELRMIQNHQDSITTLPPGAVLLATSRGVPRAGIPCRRRRVGSPVPSRGFGSAAGRLGRIHAVGRRVGPRRAARPGDGGRAAQHRAGPCTRRCIRRRRP